MIKDFINKYYQYVKASKSVLRHLYHESTDIEFSIENEEQFAIQESSRNSDYL